MKLSFKVWRYFRYKSIYTLIQARTSHEAAKRQGYVFLGILFGLLLSTCWRTPTGSDKSEDNINTTVLDAKTLAKQVLVLCWIMTSPRSHRTKALHVKNTWGKRCNKLLFMSTKNDTKLHTVVLNKTEGYHYLWGKSKAAFQYMFENHFEDADWFLKADDDTFVVMENLRFMLKDYNPSSPIHFGCRYHSHHKIEYMSGGAGSVLSKEALRRLVVKALTNTSICRQNDQTSEEDVETSRCLKNVGVVEGDSRDKLGAHRFFHSPVERHVIPDASSSTLFPKLKYEMKSGLGCCSDTAIGFHRVNVNQMYAYEYLIYNLRLYRGT